jgi:hypothetical protein
VWCLAGLAAVAAGVNQASRAARLAAAAETLWGAINLAWDTAEGRLYERARATALAALGPAAFQSAWAEGQEMTLDVVVGYALAMFPEGAFPGSR